MKKTASEVRIRDWSSDVCSSDLNGREAGADFRKALGHALADQPNVGDGRGEGMLAAVELVEDKPARRLYDPAKKVGPQIAAAMLEKGVIARAMPQGDIIGFAPPLCLSRAEADVIVEATSAAVKAVEIGRASWRERGCQTV